ncbi:hypothetical protein BsWGS_01294 [Bradybaena similaris]
MRRHRRRSASCSYTCCPSQENECVGTLQPCTVQQKMSSERHPCALSADLNVPFPSDREAEIACGSLSVDKEPKRGGVRKTMSVKGNVMHVHFEAEESRTLRVSINSFFEHLRLVSQTMDSFGPPR